MMPHMAMAQLQGTDTTPGTACSDEDAVLISANPSGVGGYFLTCESGQWVATLSAATPTANEQVATKEYVDTAAAGAAFAIDDTDCEEGKKVNLYWNAVSAEPEYRCVPDPCAADLSDPADAGTVCEDGSIYIGDMGGYDIHVAPADESGTTWGGYGTDENGDNSSVPPELTDDGLSNTNWLVEDSANSHPAAAACYNKAGADWYLPAKDELNLLWLNRAAIDLAAIGIDTSGTYYWSSTESTNDLAGKQRFSDGYQGYGNKPSTLAVRCARRD